MAEPIHRDGGAGQALAHAPPPVAGPEVAVAASDALITVPPAPLPPPPQPTSRRRTNHPLVALVIAAVMVVAAVVAVSIVRIRALDDDASDLRTENASLDEQVGDLTARRAALESLFPLMTSSMSGVELTGRYRSTFVPLDGLCTYDDCADISTPSYTLIISRRGADGYGLSVEGVDGPPAPMERTGDAYSAGGLLPTSMWGNCAGVTSPTSFQFMLTTIGVDLADGELRVVETAGVYRQYDSSGQCSGESQSSFHGVRVG